jgi:hypothetical protein
VIQYGSVALTFFSTCGFLHPEHVDDKFFLNVGLYNTDTALYPIRRQTNKLRGL